MHVYIQVTRSNEESGYFIVSVFFSPDSNDKNAETPGYASRRYMSEFFYHSIYQYLSFQLFNFQAK